MVKLTGISRSVTQSLTINESLTLAGIPPQTFEYRLGSRSALEWIVDQYQVKGESDPNREDDPAYIVRLVGQVVRVSIETVVPGGNFAAATLIADGFAIRWTSQSDEPAAKKKKASKTKYTCEMCNANAWAKPGARLICGECWDIEDPTDVSYMLDRETVAADYAADAAARLERAA